MLFVNIRQPCVKIGSFARVRNGTILSTIRSYSQPGDNDKSGSSAVCVDQQSGTNGSIDVSFQGQVAILTMNRADNRFNGSFVKSFHDALDVVVSNTDIKALVTTGKGKYYSNGLDLDWLIYLANNEEAALHSFESEVVELQRRLTTFPVPTISAINGHCYAMGAILSLGHDYRMMNSHRGWWCLNEIHLGLIFAPFLFDLIKAKIGTGYAYHQAVALGHAFPAREARDAGIVQQTSGPDDLLENAVTAATNIIGKHGYQRKHLEAMKKGMFDPIYVSYTMGLATQLKQMKT